MAFWDRISLLFRHPLDQKFVLEKILRRWPLFREPAEDFAGESEEQLLILPL